MMKEYFKFSSKEEAENFTKLETPIEGVDIGGGIHASKEMSMTTHRAHAIKDPVKNVWYVSGVVGLDGEENFAKVEIDMGLIFPSQKPF